MRIHPEYDWKTLTPEKGHFCFGYYDRFAVSADNRFHLALRIPQQERLPQPGEPADVGLIDLHAPGHASGFRKVAETLAWNHQQGAMTLWLPQRPGCFLYNDAEALASGGYRPVCRIRNADSGKAEGEFPFHIYAVSNCGRWGVSLDFARIPRRGYSYALSTQPPFSTPPDMDNDGLFLVDLAAGTRKLIASYRQLVETHPLPYDLDGTYLWLNHAIFNCDASRVMVLLRHAPADAPQAARGCWWKTQLMTMNLDGSELRCPLPDIYWRNSGISHQIWGRTPRELLVDANWCGRGHEYVVFDEDRVPMRASRVSSGMEGAMGHLVFSPDGNWMLADTYPTDGVQKLALVRVATGEWTLLGTFRHGEIPTVDVRCDLHPRWSHDGRFVTVDTIHFGERKICMLDLSGLCNR